MVNKTEPVFKKRLKLTNYDQGRNQHPVLSIFYH